MIELRVVDNENRIRSYRNEFRQQDLCFQRFQGQ